MTIWIVVANSTLARFFSAPPLNANAALIELEDKVHPHTRQLKLLTPCSLLRTGCGNPM